MDLFILDDQIRRIKVFDVYESLVWSERYLPTGDFELVIETTPENREDFKEDTWLAINESDRIMVVETIDDSEDSEGRDMLTVKGRSLEKILQDRVARHTLDNTERAPRWPITGKTPGDVARHIFKRMCIDGHLDSRDKIPFIQEGLERNDTIPEPPETYDIEIEPTTVFNAIMDVCSAFGLGFGLVRNQDTSQLYFQVYTGNNLTSAQKTFTPVVFSREMESLTNTSELVSIEQVKNVAYVFSAQGFVQVYANGIDPSESGFKRRILLLTMGDVKAAAEEEGLSPIQLMERHGATELAKHRRIDAFDGEIPLFGHKYNVDYRLGDIVEMRKNNGATNYMRVTEQIFISDNQGDRSYPTLATDLYITPGSWYGWDALEEWADAEGTWGDI